MTLDNAGFDTRAIHAAHEPDPVTGAIIPPITLSATFAQEEPGNPRSGYEYARVGNPNRDILERQLANLEGAAHAATFATGLAAEDALLRSLLRPGDTIVVGDDIYGGTHRLVSTIYSQWGIKSVVVDTTDVVAVERAVNEHSPRVIWLETPSNPLLKITDIKAVVAVSGDAVVVVDSTFATPYLQRPLALGADAVVHSATKYLGGHSDVMGGVVLTNDEALAEEIGSYQSAAGATLSPFEAWLTLRGVKTLALRMDRHCENALAIAHTLDADPRVKDVFYPGLPHHPGHAVARNQMEAFGGMVSFTLANEKQARAFVTSTTLFTLAGSLGSVDSLVNHPATMTHTSQHGTATEVPGNLVRLSVGIESIEDLLLDIDRALALAVGTR